MKASLKFREDQKKPLFRAKVPLNILGLPFQSGLVAGDSKELCLNLGTLFDSGPAFRLSYRPNDPSKPFALVLKTGIGSFGSPNEAPLTMSAEFNLLGVGGPDAARSNPRFFLHFKPRFGDFSIRKSHSSSSSSVFALNSKRGGGDGSEEEDEASVESPVVVNRDYLAAICAPNGGVGKLSSRYSSTVATVVDNAVAGMEVGARTLLPIRNGAVLNLRWGVRFPEDFKGVLNATSRDGFGAGGNWSRRIPLLVMNKIGIEHVARKEEEEEEEKKKKKKDHQARRGRDEATDTWFGLRRRLEGLHAENGRMRQAVDDLRAEFANSSSSRVRFESQKEGEACGVGLTGGETSVSDELKNKSLIGARQS